jgi:hypothetical protein
MCAVALICLLLAGPGGPCGPGTLLGSLFMIGGYFVGLAGWLLCAVSLTVIMRKSDTRSSLRVPALVATPVAGALAVLVTRPDEPRAHTWWILVCLWPPLAAAVSVVQAWLHKHAAGRVTLRK